ncbi:hypothetical protein RF074_25425, partial [Serratia marcescens]
ERRVQSVCRNGLPYHAQPGADVVVVSGLLKVSIVPIAGDVEAIAAQAGDEVPVIYCHLVLQV